MPLPVPVSKGKFVDVEDGTWPAQVVKVGQKTIENDQYGNGHKALLYLEFPDFIDEETGDFAVLDAMANFVISPKSKLYEWLTALGVEVDLEGDEVDIEDAIGRDCLAVVEHNEGKDRAWPRVTSIIAPPKARRSASQASSAPAVIKADGSADLNVFWAAVRAFGITRKNVADHVGGDIETLIAMDGPDVAQVLDELKGKATA